MGTFLKHSFKSQTVVPQTVNGAEISDSLNAAPGLSPNSCPMRVQKVEACVPIAREGRSDATVTS